MMKSFPIWNIKLFVSVYQIDAKFLKSILKFSEKLQIL